MDGCAFSWHGECAPLFIPLVNLKDVLGSSVMGWGATPRSRAALEALGAGWRSAVVRQRGPALAGTSPHVVWLGFDGIDEWGLTSLAPTTRGPIACYYSTVVNNKILSVGRRYRIDRSVCDHTSEENSPKLHNKTVPFGNTAKRLASPSRVGTVTCWPRTQLRSAIWSYPPRYLSIPRFPSPHNQANIPS